MIDKLHKAVPIIKRTKKVYLTSVLTVLILRELSGFTVYCIFDLLTGLYTDSPE